MNLFDDIVNKRAKRRVLETFTSSLDALGYPYELIEKNPSEDEAVSLYRQALENGAREGYFPVLVPQEPMLFELIRQAKQDGFDIASALLSQKPDCESVFASRLADSELTASELYADEDEPLSDIIAEGFSALDGFSLLFTEFSRSFRMTALIKLPTIKPWEAAIYLPFGGWNECPAPLEMAAMLKAWHEKYGAVPAVFAGESLEVLLETPLGEAESREAAREIIAFCGLAHAPMDERSKGYAELAKNLEGKRVWHFWWD